MNIRAEATGALLINWMGLRHEMQYEDARNWLSERSLQHKPVVSWGTMRLRIEGASEMAFDAEDEVSSALLVNISVPPVRTEKQFA